jgi:single-strand DNA-binding protein
MEKYVQKGKEIAVEGKLTYRTYDDKDGQKRFLQKLE